MTAVVDMQEVEMPAPLIFTDNAAKKSKRID